MMTNLVNQLKKCKNDCVSEATQLSIFDEKEHFRNIHKIFPNRDNKRISKTNSSQAGFQLQNRRYLGSKHKLLDFIEDIVNEKCDNLNIFCDIFAGTGVVANRFNRKNVRIIANDFLNCNFIPLKAFLATSQINYSEIRYKINFLNNFAAGVDNYFSEKFGNTYFTVENAKKIGAIREKIEEISSDDSEKSILITSLIYAVDKVANTVGHYDAYRSKLDSVKTLELLVPEIKHENNENNQIFRENANVLIQNIRCDVLYLDPPYNSRQYSDSYHLIENLANWEKPVVHGVAKKMDRAHIKSEYCLQSAAQAMMDLVKNADCKHILLSYNNTGQKKDGRSNARINDDQILSILNTRGKVEVFEREYKAYTTGKSSAGEHSERIFYCRISKN